MLSNTRYTRVPVGSIPMGTRVRVVAGTGTGCPQNTRGLPVHLPNVVGTPLAEMSNSGLEDLPICPVAIEAEIWQPYGNHFSHS